MLSIHLSILAQCISDKRSMAGCSLLVAFLDLHRLSVCSGNSDIRFLFVCLQPFLPHLSHSSHCAMVISADAEE